MIISQKQLDELYRARSQQDYHDLLEGLKSDGVIVVTEDEEEADFGVPEPVALEGPVPSEGSVVEIPEEARTGFGPGFLEAAEPFGAVVVDEQSAAELAGEPDLDIPDLAVEGVPVDELAESELSEDVVVDEADGLVPVEPVEPEVSEGEEDVPVES